MHCGSPSTSSKSSREDAAGWRGSGLGPRSIRRVCARACGPREAPQHSDFAAGTAMPERTEI
eukprot:4795707-Pyramimonas_sp.AAC.1